MDETTFRRNVREKHATHSSAVEELIWHQLSTDIDLGHSERLQFEIDPFSFGITLIQTEEVVFPEPDDLIPQDPDDDVEKFDTLECVCDELVSWFADRWVAAGGPARYSPAYVFFHGGMDTPRYDLEQKRWCSVEEVWPDNS